MPHATGTHHTALRLACGGVYPSPGSIPFRGLRLLDLGSGAHPFPHVDGGPAHLRGIRERVTVDLPGALEPEIAAMAEGQTHLQMSLDGLDGLDRGLFDVISVLEIIEHIENPWRLLRMVAASLTPTGCAVVSTPDITNESSRAHFVEHGTFPWFGAADIDGQGHLSPILPHMLTGMASRAGLAITEWAHNEPPDNIPASEADPVRGTILVVRMEHAR